MYKVINNRETNSLEFRLDYDTAPLLSLSKSEKHTHIINSCIILTRELRVVLIVIITNPLQLSTQNLHILGIVLEEVGITVFLHLSP
jgi:hypothetical protein